MAEVARQLDALDARILAVHRADPLHRPVARAVVDQDQLESGAERLEHPEQAPAQLADRRFLVEERDDHGDEDFAQ